jgi:uncharacterized membrane protein
MTENTSEPKLQNDNHYELLYAIDRTTHAARALPLFIFTLIITGMMATILFLLSVMVRLNCQSGDCGGGFYLGAAWVVGAGGLLAGLILGVNELSKSKVYEN